MRAKRIVNRYLHIYIRSTGLERLLLYIRCVEVLERILTTSFHIMHAHLDCDRDLDCLGHSSLQDGRFNLLHVV